MSKEVDAGHYYTITSCQTVGKVTVCTPQPMWDDTDYLLRVKGDDGKVRTADVSKEIYDRAEVGTQYGVKP